MTRERLGAKTGRIGIRDGHCFRELVFLVWLILTLGAKAEQKARLMDLSMRGRRDLG